MEFDLIPPIIYALITAAAVFAGAIGYILGGRSPSGKVAGLSDEIAELNTKNDSLQKSIEAHIENATRATTELTIVKQQRDEASDLANRLRTDMESLKQAVANAEQARALAEQHAANVDDEAKRWDDVKLEVGKVASEATLKSSSKLIDDHKRETELAKKESEKIVKETTEALTHEIKTVVKSVASLDSDVKQTEKLMDTIHRALSAPSSAGHAAETVLENVLKNFGLTEGQDFTMQHTVDGDDGKLRPDAVVFLPGDTILVIDAKASKHILDLAEAEEQDEATIEAAYQNLRSSMNKHLRDLKVKDYTNAVNKHYRAKTGAISPQQTTTFMFLPNDGAVEKLLTADPQFALKASHDGIIVGGPSGLWASVAVAKMRIDLGRQAENQQKIIEELENLFQSIAIVLEHGARLGKGLTQATKAYDKFAKSVNSRLISRSNKLIKLGISAPSKGIHEIPRLVTQDDFIDAAADDITDATDLPLLSDKDSSGE